MNEYVFDEIPIGCKETFTCTITPDMEEKFREISGDQNPLHQDDAFAAQVSGRKFTGHVVFGMLTASFYSTMAGVYLPGKYSLIHSFEELSFRKPVFSGDTLTVTGEVVAKEPDLRLIRLNVVIQNQHGQTVSRAKMKVLVMK